MQHLITTLENAHHVLTAMGIIFIANLAARKRMEPQLRRVSTVVLIAVLIITSTDLAVIYIKS